MPRTTTTNAVEHIDLRALCELAERNAGIPEPRFQCEGAQGTITADRMEAIHFQDKTGGYHRPSELYYAELVERDTQWNGYFCQECLESFGKKPGKRLSLLKVIKERIEQNQREANDKLTRALRIK